MQVRDIAEEIGLRFVGLGSDPVSRPGDVPYIPKRRYHIVDRYHTSSSRDGFGREFMLSTTSTQVCALAEQTPAAVMVPCACVTGEIERQLH